MNYVLFGIQGSGKGTQAKIIANKHNYTIFETGAELRKLAQEESPLGQKVKSIIESGNLVSNETVMEIVENFVNSQPQEQKIIFDGIPRQKVQAESFNSLMLKLGKEFKCILIEVSKSEAVKRMLSRTIIKDGKEVKRKDDNPEAIEKRLQIYFDETYPVIESYKEQNQLISINGEQSIEDVTTEIFTKIEF